MALQFSLILLILAFALVVESSTITDAQLGVTHFSIGASETYGLASPQTCDGLVGECINQEDELTTDPDIIRRSLSRGRRWISYDALRRDRVPCNRRGSSYYGCGRASRVNPYRRGCSRITHCQRYLK